VYGFARLADALGDEIPGDRLAALDALEADLDRAFAGRAQHPLLRDLTPVLRERDLPREPFVRLIEANRQDQRVTRYARRSDLADYCALSANPVGELVLHLVAAATPERVVLSDAICSALQLLEHCQDVAEDRARGRVYLPAEDLARAGCGEADLASTPASAALRAAVAEQTARAQRLLADGEPLVARLRGAARIAVAGFVAGGYAARDALVRAGYDVGAGAPRARRRDLVRHALAVLWRQRRRA
jgi:squalene synthase HpnC